MTPERRAVLADRRVAVATLRGMEARSPPGSRDAVVIRHARINIMSDWREADRARRKDR